MNISQRGSEECNIEVVIFLFFRLFCVEGMGSFKFEIYLDGFSIYDELKFKNQSILASSASGSV